MIKLLNESKYFSFNIPILLQKRKAAEDVFFLIQNNHNISDNEIPDLFHL